MGKKRKARGTVPVAQNARGQAFEFDYEKLAEAIVQAQVEAEVLHEKSKEKLAEEQQREWLKTLGPKTYSKENCVTRNCKYGKLQCGANLIRKRDVGTLGIIKRTCKRS